MVSSADIQCDIGHTRNALIIHYEENCIGATFDLYAFGHDYDK